MIRTETQDTPSPPIGSNSLRNYVSRIEKLEAERKLVLEDLKEVYTEAESAGYEKGALKLVVKMRAEDPKKREKRIRRESDAAIYNNALGEV